MRKGILAFGLLSLYCLPSFACDEQGKSGIVEENNLYISTDAKSVSTISEAEFNKVIDRVEALYSPVVTARGKKLVIQRNWTDGTVNAYASRKGNNWEVAMFGGLARHETITSDGFALVVCHELGHHIGGLPKKRSLLSTWASNEGQADYFATLKCFRKYAEGQDNVTMMAQANVPAAVKEKCQAQFGNQEDAAICERGAMAGMSLGMLFRDLRRQTAPVDFMTPDRTVVSTTNDAHPAPQCRLDTYYAGAYCDQSADTDVSDTNANQGVCVASRNEQGPRPLCWFKP